MSAPDRLPPLDLLASFEACARQLSFTKAAEERFITQSAMSRQMRTLEEELGAALFKRQHRSLVLTPDGQRLLAATAQALAVVRSAVREIRAPRQREALALTTTPGFAALWLIPRLAGFTRAHPGIDVRLEASFESRNLAADGFDVAVRFAPTGKVSDGVPLFDETLQPVCSPRLIASSAKPLRVPRDLSQHPLLHVEMDRAMGGMPTEWEPWLAAMGLAGLQAAARLSFTHYADAIAAAVAGQGVAMGRRPLVNALLDSGQLVTPFEDSTASAMGYVVLVEAASKGRPAVQAFEAWLLAQAAQTLSPA